MHCYFYKNKVQLLRNFVKNFFFHFFVTKYIYKCLINGFPSAYKFIAI